MAQTAATKTLLKPKSYRISYDEFLKRGTDDEHLEWVDGKVVPMSPVTLEHEDKRNFLLAILREYVLLNKLGKVGSEPYNMKIGYGLPGRAPDILVVLNANLARMHNEYLDGPADLVVEIISPESRRRDRVTKFAEYERGGVREYWMLEPKRKTTEFFVRDENGKFQPVTVGQDGIYNSTVLPGFWLKTEWLWQNPLPSTTEIVRAWQELTASESIIDS